MLKKPIFLIGTPFNGSGIVANILGLHKNILNIGEIKILWDINSMYNKLESFPDIGKTLRLRTSDVSNIFSKLIDGICHNAMTTANKERVVESSPTNIFMLDRLLGIFPDARFIHVVRDGREVAKDMIAFPQAIVNNGDSDEKTKDLKQLCLYWSTMVQQITKFKMNNKLPLFNLKLEELIEYPEVTLELAFNFIDECHGSHYESFYTKNKDVIRDMLTIKPSEHVFTEEENRLILDNMGAALKDMEYPI